MKMPKKGILIVISALLLVIVGLLVAFFGQDLLPRFTRQQSPALRQNGREVYYPILSTDAYLNFYQPVVSWKDYTDATLHRQDFSIPSVGDASLEIGCVDDALNLYVGAGQQMPSGAVLADRIGVFSTTENRYIPLAEVDSKSRPRIECANDRYIVWSTDSMELSRDSICIQDRSTGEVMTFALPLASPISYELLHETGPGVVLVGDQAFFHAMNPAGGQGSIFCIDIPSRTVEVFRTDAGGVVAYPDGFLWREPGKHVASGEFTIHRFLNGRDEVIQTLPADYQLIGFSGDIGVTHIEKKGSWVWGPDGRTFTAEGLLQQGSVWVFHAGEAAPLIAVKDGLEDERLDKMRMTTNEYYCRIQSHLAVIEYSVTMENLSRLLLYDTQGKAILKIEELSDGECTPFQTENKLLFIKQVNSPDGLTGTIYWIDKAEFAKSRINAPDRSVKRTNETMATTVKIKVPTALRDAVLVASKITPSATAGGMVFDKALEIAWRKMGQPDNIEEMAIRLVPSGSKWECSYSNLEFVEVGKWFYMDSFSIDGATGETSGMVAADGIKQP